MTDDFATHIPAWRIRRLRGVLRAAEEEGRRGESDEPDDHRAILRRRARGRAAMRPAGTSRASLRSVLRYGRLLSGDRRRVDFLLANARRHFTAAKPPRGALATAYADLKAEMKAAGLATPKRHRWRAWLAYAGFVPLPSAAAAAGAGTSRGRPDR
jgi:hypothetical protein